mmetsp:Transcript_3853/g.9802  ORF Transcript_3853/g.9802 Transcript_3853/m.9802 type:complete len:381 (+) Transcript_3853:28-1170(+)
MAAAALGVGPSGASRAPPGRPGRRCGPERRLSPRTRLPRDRSAEGPWRCRACDQDDRQRQQGWPRRARVLSDGSIGDKVSAAAQCAAASVGLWVAGSAVAHAAPLVVVPGLVGDNEIREGFTSGLLLTLVSEIGDKTFFVAMLLAMRESSSASEAGSGSGLGGKSAVFLGTFSALAVMTVISCGIGLSFHSLDEAFSGFYQGDVLPLDDLAAIVLLTFFGVTSLRSASQLQDGDGDGPLDSWGREDGGEEEEARQLLKDRKLLPEQSSPAVAGAVDDVGHSDRDSAWALALTTFTLVFAAEWGDRSFLSTIALSAAYPPAGVVFGAIGGHGIATVLAIGGGAVLAQYISERVVALTGGVLFLTFAAATLWDLLSKTFALS